MKDKRIYKILVLIFLFILGILYNKLTLYENFTENIIDNNINRTSSIINL